MKWWKMLRESSKNEEELKIFEREKTILSKIIKTFDLGKNHEKYQNFSKFYCVEFINKL